MNNKRNITHLEINGKHEYFGSPAALYNKYTAEELGITQGSLNNHFYRLKDGEEQIYVNKICTIRKGPLQINTSKKVRNRKDEDSSSQTL